MPSVAESDWELVLAKETDAGSVKASGSDEAQVLVPELVTVKVMVVFAAAVKAASSAAAKVASAVEEMAAFAAEAMVA